MLAFVTNRSFIDSRTFDGFRKTVAQEFFEVYVVDLGGDWKRQDSADASGGNVFGIGTGVAISFFVRKQAATKGGPPCRIRYVAAGKFAISGAEKLAWLTLSGIARLKFEEIRPDPKGTWLNLTESNFDGLLPIASKETKVATLATRESAVFKLFSLGVVTARDEWVYGATKSDVQAKTAYLVGVYNGDLDRSTTSKKRLDDSELTYGMKWTRAVKKDLAGGIRYLPEQGNIVRSEYRPFDVRLLHFNGRLVEVQYQQARLFGETGDLQNVAIVFTDASSQKPFMVLACAQVFDYHFVGAAAAASGMPLYRYDEGGNRIENITDWSLAQFKKHYQPGRGKKAQPITKEAIFHYVYAVLHDPLYREKYAQNLKREFPRIPLYGESEASFWQWVGWGSELMALHIGYEAVAPFALKRTDVPDEKVRAAGQWPKPSLKADKEAGRIVVDSETTLSGVPASAWRYLLGNRSALEWVLDQHKEKKPKDPTIREKFDTYRFADHKERVIDLLARVATLSVETMRIVDAMKTEPR